MLILLVLIGVVGALGGGVVGTGPAGAVLPAPALAPAAAVSVAPAGGEAAVTLVTGDRVLLRPGAGREHGVEVRAGKGRAQVRFHQYTEGGHVYVVPGDAVAPLAAGRLDRRLFDVTRLVQYGYDDRTRRDLPLVVVGAGAASSRTALRDRLAGLGTRVVRELASVGATVVREDKAAAGAFWSAVRGGPGAGPVRGAGLAPGVGRVWLDGRVTATLDQSVPQIGAPAAWQAGYTAKGVKVAVLDTGLDLTHPDLAGAVEASRDFTGSASGVQDRNGHGTHVASIVTGDGAASGGRYRGVAPDARLLVGKVLSDDGFGSESGIVAGMEWAVAAGARVVNLSLGDGDTPDVDPMEAAINQLTAATGTLFVTAAGNGGPDAGTVTSPASADAALAVGAVTKQDELAPFSSRGPRVGDNAIKPDLTAPGVDIVAARAHDTDRGSPVGASYTRLSGTSMAAPHVTGAAAIVAGEHPGWTAEQIKAALMGSAVARGDVDGYQQGAGRVDVGRAVAQAVYASPPSLPAGVARWPHDDDQPIGRTVTYTNGGTAPVTLDLSVELRDPSGRPAPLGMGVAAPSRIAVPPGARVPVTVTFDTSLSGPDGTYSGALTARETGGSTTVHTPLALSKEVESYDARLTVLDHHGSPASDYFLGFHRLPDDAEFPVDAGNVRLPAGRYFLAGWIDTELGDGQFAITDIVEPELTITGDTAMTLDARDGRQPGVTVDRSTAAIGGAAVDLTWRTPAGEEITGRATIMPNFDGYYIRPSRGSAPPGRFTFSVVALLAEPDGTGGYTGSRYLYHVNWSQDGRVPAAPTRHLRDRELAVVHARHAAATAVAQTGLRDDIVARALPFALTEYFSAGFPGQSFLRLLADPADPFSDRAVLYSAGAARVPGRSSTERWNAAVFGPGFPAAPRPFASRLEDRMAFDLPLFSDQTPSHYGYSLTDGGETRLYRDGRQIASGPDAGYLGFAVPAEPASYRLETEATRSGVSDLSTRLQAVWTFRSGHTDPPKAQPLPLMAVRFAPDLDDRNRAPAGRFSFPVYVQGQANAAFGDRLSLTVQVSFDDGATWRRVSLTGSRDRWTATVEHPRGAAFAALKATAVDSAGNRVDETIVRAYAVHSS